ncbi:MULTISPECIES: hypothetical protein [Sporomusa]
MILITDDGLPFIVFYSQEDNLPKRACPAGEMRRRRGGVYNK